MRIITREEWGARYPDGFGPAPLPAEGVYLHHTVTMAPDLVPPFDDDYQAIRTLERIGQQRFGGGISYTLLTTPVGLAFEGHSIDRRGAHTRGLNSTHRAIAMVGNYQDTDPTPQMKQAIAELLVHGKRMGWWKRSRLIGGHRQAPGASTACPGDRGMVAIYDIHMRAAALESEPVPQPPPIEEEEEEDMILTYGASDRKKYGDKYATSGPVAQWQNTMNRGLTLFKISFNGGGNGYAQGSMLKVDGEFGDKTVDATTVVTRAVQEYLLAGRPIYSPHVTDIGVSEATQAWLINGIARKAVEVYRT